MRKPIIAIALTAFASIAGVQAQTYPSRQLTIVAPFPPGRSTDVVGRIIGQPIIIENVGGAGGSIAVGRVVTGPRQRVAFFLSLRRHSAGKDFMPLIETGSA